MRSPPLLGAQSPYAGYGLVRYKFDMSIRKLEIWHVYVRCVDAGYTIVRCRIHSLPVLGAYSLCAGCGPVWCRVRSLVARIGGVLRILGGSKFVHEEALRRHLLSCQSQFGGFGKFPGELPELYHSYYGFCAFSLLEEAGLNSLCVELGITNRAAHGA
ncbi:hypothetical protein Dimus_021090 [Dionaea muscipula]